MHYEEFGERPNAAMAALTEKIPALTSIDSSCNLRVKDYPIGPAVNMNEEAIATLSAEALEAISLKLSADRDVLDRLGYRLRSG